MNLNELKQGIDKLLLIDDDVANAFKRIGYPPERKGEHSFIALLSIIIGQQISIKAAEAIKARVLALAPQLTAQKLLELDDEVLRNAGLSQRKMEYAKGLANAIVTGELDIDALTNQSNEQVIETITSLRGFGRWSAEIYLLFSLKRLDIFPADDLGILQGLAHLKGMKDKPLAKQAREITEHWSPNRSAGALFLWFYYHKVTIEKKHNYLKPTINKAN